MFEKIVKLKDNSQILIRFLDKSDKEILLKGFAKLSQKSRYYRFLVPLTSLSKHQINLLLEKNDKNHFIIGALDINRGLDYGVAVARYTRYIDYFDRAEFAITIIDEYQGNGLGKILLDLLATNARDNGITTFIGYFIESNVGIKSLVKDFNPTITHEEGNIYRMEFNLNKKLIEIEN